MSPLVASPNRGYADWQRINNYDSGILWRTTTGVTSGPVSSPLMDMSRYGYVGGFIRELASLSTVTFTWFADSGATIVAGSRTFNLSASVNSTAQLRISNLGPFLQITVTQVAGGTFNLDTLIFGTNRDSPLELFPPTPQLVPGQTQNIGAGASIFVWAASYYAGPIRVWVSTSGTGFVSLLAAQGGAFPIVVETFAPISNTNQGYTTVVPASAWELQVSNSGAGAANFSFAVTAAMTGAI